MAVEYHNRKEVFPRSLERNLDQLLVEDAPRGGIIEDRYIRPERLQDLLNPYFSFNPTDFTAEARSTDNFLSWPRTKDFLILDSVASTSHVKRKLKNPIKIRIFLHQPLQKFAENSRTNKIEDLLSKNRKTKDNLNILNSLGQRGRLENFVKNMSSIKGEDTARKYHLGAALCGIDLRNINVYEFNEDEKIFAFVIWIQLTRNGYDLDKKCLPRKPRIYIPPIDDNGNLRLIDTITDFILAAYTGALIKEKHINKESIDRSYSSVYNTGFRRPTILSLLKIARETASEILPITPSIYIRILTSNITFLRKVAFHYTRGDTRVLIMTKVQLHYLLTHGHFPKMVKSRIEKATKRINELMGLNEMQLELLCTIHKCDSPKELLNKQKIPLEEFVIQYGKISTKKLAKSIGMIIPPGENQDDYYLNNLIYYRHIFSRNPSKIVSDKGKLGLRTMMFMIDLELFNFCKVYVPYSSRVKLISNLFSLQYHKNFFVPLNKSIIMANESDTPLFMEDACDPKLFVFGYGKINRINKTRRCIKPTNNFITSPGRSPLSSNPSSGEMKARIGKAPIITVTITYSVFDTILNQVQTYRPENTEFSTNVTATTIPKTPSIIIIPKTTKPTTTKISKNYYIMAEELISSFTWINTKGEKINDINKFFMESRLNQRLSWSTTSNFSAHTSHTQTTTQYTPRDIIENLFAQHDIEPRNRSLLRSIFRTISDQYGASRALADIREMILPTNHSNATSSGTVSNENFAELDDFPEFSDDEFSDDGGDVATTSTSTFIDEYINRGPTGSTDEFSDDSWTDNILGSDEEDEGTTSTTTNTGNNNFDINPSNLIMRGATFKFRCCFEEGEHTEHEIQCLKKLATIYVDKADKNAELAILVSEGLQARIKMDYEERRQIIEFTKFTRSDKTHARGWFMALFKTGMYMRRWKGPGHPYPLGSASTKISIQHAELEVIISRSYGKLESIESKLSTKLLKFIKNLKISKFKNQKFIKKNKKIGNEIAKVKAGDECIRMASSNFVGTAYRYLLIFFGEKIPNFNPTKVDEIM